MEGGVQVAHQFQQLGRGVAQGQHDGLVQPEDDGQLQQQGKAGTKGVDAQFLVEFHLLLGQALPVVLVLLLDFLPSGVLLKPHHGFLALGLLLHEGVQGQPNEHGKQDNGQPEVSHVGVQPQKQVEHRFQNESVPHARCS